MKRLDHQPVIAPVICDVTGAYLITHGLIDGVGSSALDMRVEGALLELVVQLLHLIMLPGLLSQRIRKLLRLPLQTLLGELCTCACPLSLVMILWRRLSNSPDSLFRSISISALASCETLSSCVLASCSLSFSIRVKYSW